MKTLTSPRNLKVFLKGSFLLLFMKNSIKISIIVAVFGVVTTACGNVSLSCKK